MQTIVLVAQAFGAVVAGLAAAVLFCCLAWQVFRLVHHPEWAALTIAALLALAWAGRLPKSQVLDMALLFALVAALPLWFAGRASHERDAPPLPAPPSKAKRSLPYPAIRACICEERPPSRAEIHRVAERLWREGLAPRYGAPSFAARRALVRAAKGALGGGIMTLAGGSRAPIPAVKGEGREPNRGQYGSSG